MPWGAIPEVPGGGCPERGIGCPMAPRLPIPPRDCPGPRGGMPIPAAPAAGPPVRLCSAFIGSVGTQGHHVSGRHPLNRLGSRGCEASRDIHFFPPPGPASSKPQTVRRQSPGSPSHPSVTAVTPQGQHSRCVSLCSGIMSPPGQGPRPTPLAGQCQGPDTKEQTSP